MDNPQNPNSEKSQQIKLNQVAKQFMFGLQRHFDLLAFNLAAQETIQENAYNERAAATQVMPFLSHHQNFEQLQAYARDILVRQVVNDSLNLALTAMNNVHFFLALIKATGTRTQVSLAAKSEAQTNQKEFIVAKLDEKFNQLETEYGIRCELEDSITSLGFILQILVKQGGVVKKEQLDNDGKMILELKSIEIQTSESITDIKPNTLKTIRKIYYEDDIVLFEDVELQLLLVTVASFADSLFKSVLKYAHSVKNNM